MPTTPIAVGDHVSWNQDDSRYRTNGVVLAIETVDNGGYVPDYDVYVVKDDRRGWVHRVSVEYGGLTPRPGSGDQPLAADDNVPF